MELIDEYRKELERDKFLIVRNKTTNTPYAIFELKDEPGAVANFGGPVFIVTTTKEKEEECGEHDTN